METRLAPIEQPSSLMMKLTYYFSKKTFGKVLTPLKVVYSRLPISFGLFARKISELDKQLSLDPAMAYMVKILVAQINTCHFCMDIAKSIVIQRFQDPEKFYKLNEYKTSSLFTAKEKAGLLFAEELTVNKAISDATFENARQHFTERELAELVWSVATEHYYNMINIAFKIESDNLCDLRQSKKVVLA